MAFHWNCKLEEEEFPEDDLVLGCFDEEGGILAELEYFVRDSFWGDSTLPLVCVGGVASLPHHRRGGAVRRLFGELETLAVKEGWALGALYPFSDGYYRQYGYERMARGLVLETPMQAIFDFAQSVPKSAPGRLELVEGKTLPDDLLRIYNTFAAQTPLMLRRGQTEAKWFCAKPLEECKYCMLWRNGRGEAEGYIQYNLRLDIRTLNVDELAFLSPAALKGMLCFLRGYASKADKVIFYGLPWGSPLPLLLNEHSKTITSYCKNAAVRIYDVEKVLRRTAFAGDFTLSVEGDSIARNNGTWQVAGGRAERTGSPAPVTVTREALVLLLSGQIKDMMALRCCPGVRIDGEAGANDLVSAIQQLKIPYMWDGF